MVNVFKGKIMALHTYRKEGLLKTVFKELINLLFCKFPKGKELKNNVNTTTESDHREGTCGSAQHYTGHQAVLVFCFVLQSLPQAVLKRYLHLLPFLLEHWLS